MATLPEAQPASKPVAVRATSAMAAELPDTPEVVAPPDTTPRLSFLQQPWVQNVLPLITSLALHMALVLVGLLVWRVGKEMQEQRVVAQEQIIIPDSSLASDVPGAVDNPGIGDDPTRPAAQDETTENTHPDGWAPKPGESPIAQAMGGGSGDTADSLIGLGTGGFGKGAGRGAGLGDTSGSGSGDGRGRLAPFGAPGGGMPGPRGRVFGSGGNARTIAFVCDSSGSMIDKFASLKRELGKAIEGLKPIQSFSIVFFRDGKAPQFENGRLVPATADNKRNAYKWLESLGGTTGTSDPLPALSIAFKDPPDLVYVLTDGDFPNNDEVLNRVGQLNKQKRSRVNTVAFVTSKNDQTSQSFLDFLKRLATDNGGAFRFVALDELD